MWALAIFIAVSILWHERSITTSAYAKPEHPTTWPGLRVRGTNIVDHNGKSVLLRGVDPGEWYNIEAYMIKWPDNDQGPVFYGDGLIRKTLVELGMVQ